MPTVSSGSTRTVRIGPAETALLALDPARLYLFDKASNRLLLYGG
jgi:hypothetical protein